MIDAITVFGANSSMGVSEKSSNLYQNLGGGMVPLAQNRPLRLERELIYEDCGGLHAVTFEYFSKKKKILGDRNSSVNLDYLSCFKVSNYEDLRIANSIEKALT